MSDTVRVYTWSDSGLFDGIEECTTGAATVTDGGFGDHNVVFEIPRELWERYEAATTAMLKARREIYALGDAEPDPQPDAPQAYDGPTGASCN